MLRLAPASDRAIMAGPKPACAASCAAVRPCCGQGQGIRHHRGQRYLSAPPSSDGLEPTLSTASMSAPKAASKRIVRSWPYRAATCSGVRCRRDRALGSPPHCTSSSTCQQQAVHVRRVVAGVCEGGVFVHSPLPQSWRRGTMPCDRAVGRHMNK